MLVKIDLDDQRADLQRRGVPEEEAVQILREAVNMCGDSVKEYTSPGHYLETMEPRTFFDALNTAIRHVEQRRKGGTDR
jgi:hypothetical protein